MNASSNNFCSEHSLFYPREIVEACGGETKFNELQIVDWQCLEGVGPSGPVKEEAVSEPIMIGRNYYQNPFIILTFDVYDSQGKKIEEKISEVFHRYDNIVNKFYPNTVVWYGSYQLNGNIHGGFDKPVLEIANRIKMLLNGQSVREPHRFNNGKTSYIKLWDKNSPTQE